MPDIRKWNHKTRAYEPYTPPDGRVSMNETNMETRISCASCGCQITFGEGYTSQLIHNSFGMGYTVCESCHVAELAEELKARKERICNG